MAGDQAISGIIDPDQIRVLLFINNQQVHAPVVDVVTIAMTAGVLPGDLDLGGNSLLNADNVVSTTKVTTFTASGTFTPDAKMLFCNVLAWGGGGAGGGAVATGAAQRSIGSGGNAGAKSQARLTAAQIGASQPVTIGAGGTGVAGAAGNAGAATTLGALVSAAGGQGGNASAASGALKTVFSPATTQSATGDVRGHTSLGGHGNDDTGGFPYSGYGGSNEWGGGAVTNTTANSAGTAGLGQGAGGSGALNGASQAARAGGAGHAGVMIITEYLHS